MSLDSHSQFFLDSGVPVPSRIKVEKHDPLENIAYTLVEIRTLLERLLATDRTGAVSSVVVKFTAATKDRESVPAPELKRYTGSEPEVEQAIADYGRAVLLMEQAQRDGWERTDG